MGPYTGIRFKGFIKPKFKKGFEIIAINGEWEKHVDPIIKSFGNIGESCFIPNGSLSYMPKSWETKPDSSVEIYSKEWFESMKPTDGFETSYDEKTGYWTFQCSLKNHEDEIESFFEILPHFVESIEHLECFCEDWKYSKKYELKNDKIVKINDKFIKY